MILKLFCLFIASLTWIKTTNATKFSKETIQGFMDDPYLKQLLIEFSEAGYGLITDKIEKEIKMLQIMYKNKEYIDNSIMAGFGVKLVEYLHSDNYYLRLEAIKSVKKAAFYDEMYAEEIVDRGAMPQLIKHLHSGDSETVIESLRAIRTIIKYPVLREQFFELGLAEHLVEFVKIKASKEILSEIANVIMLLTLNQEDPISRTSLNALLPAFKELIRHPHPEIAQYISWALVFLTDEGNKRYKIYFNKGIVKDLFTLISHQDRMVRGGAIGVISNIVNGKNDQTKMALDNGILKLLPELLMDASDAEQEKEPSTIVKDTLLLIVKLFPTSKKQAKEIFDTGVMPLIIYHLARGSLEEQKEAAWAVSIGASFGDTNHIEKMVDLNVVTPMCDLLVKVQNTSDAVIGAIMSGLSEILAKSKPERIEQIYQLLEKCQGIEAIDNLHDRADEEIKELSFKIMKNFISAETDAMCKTAAS